MQQYPHLNQQQQLPQQQHQPAHVPQFPAPAALRDLEIARNSTGYIDIHDFGLWYELAAYRWMIATFPPMFIPKGTTREATAEAIRIVVGFINRFSAIFSEANFSGRYTYSEENAQEWFRFLSAWSSKTGKPIHAYDMVNMKAQGTGLSFFAVALVALDLRSRSDATFFRRAILASRNTSIEEFQALANKNGEGLVAHPSVFLGSTSVNINNSASQKGQGRPRGKKEGADAQ